MKPTLRPLRNQVRGILAAAMICAAGPMSGQTIYSHVDPDGRHSFSDLPPPAPEAPTPTGPRQEVAGSLANNAALSTARSRAVDRKEAARRLGQAQKARDHGAGYLPGERLQANAEGGVNTRYWRRQERLRRTVEQAQRRSNETQR